MSALPVPLPSPVVDVATADTLRPLVVLAAWSLHFPTAVLHTRRSTSWHTLSTALAGSPSMDSALDALRDATVKAGGPLVVPAARRDARFSRLPAVQSGDVGSYLGIPIRCGGAPLGVIGVVDTESRVITTQETARLADFAAQLGVQMDLAHRLAEERRTGSVATAELRRAIRAHHITPWYQPVVDLSSGRTIGYEALARWVHPDGEVKDPDQFIPLVHGTDLAVELDLSVMQQALSDLHRWQRRNPGLRMAVNVCGQHAGRSDAAAVLDRIARRAEVDTRTVDIELTDVGGPEAGSAHTVFVERLRSRGFTVWLDDFGSSWSPLEHLMGLPVDGIKINRKIALSLGTDVGDAVTRSVTGMAGQLGLSTVLTGIQDVEHAARAQAMGYDRGQGKHWAAPAPAAVIGLRLAAQGGAIPSRAAGPQPVRRAAIAGTLAGAVLDALPDATAVLDSTGVIVAVNRAWREFGDDNAGVGDDVGTNYLAVCLAAAEQGVTEAGEVAREITAVLGGQVREAEVEYPCPTPARHRWFLARITPLAGTSAGAVVSHVDITRRKKAELELAYAAAHDPLTDLPTRTVLTTRLQAALDQLHDRAPDAHVGLLFIDLDGFKAINDTYGHGAGDDILVTVGRRLESVTQSGQTAARVGGDEFVVLAPRIDRTALDRMVLDVRAVLSRPHEIHGRPVVVTGSVGAHLADPGEDADQALERADRAMYRQKGPQGRTLLPATEVATTATAPLFSN